MRAMVDKSRGLVKLMKMLESNFSLLYGEGSHSRSAQESKLERCQRSRADTSSDGTGSDGGQEVPEGESDEQARSYFHRDCHWCDNVGHT